MDEGKGLFYQPMGLVVSLLGLLAFFGNVSVLSAIVTVLASGAGLGAVVRNVTEFAAVEAAAVVSLVRIDLISCVSLGAGFLAVSGQVSDLWKG